jgi:hypothetical protein
MRRAAGRIGNEFETLSARNTLQYDPQMGADIARVSQKYWRQLQPNQRQIFADEREAILDHLRQNQATIPGDIYQNTRSSLSDMAHSVRNSDPRLSEALRGLRGSLDDAMSRSIRVRGQSDLGEIARAGAAVLRPIPNSGTAERGHAIAAATAIPTSIGASLMTGDVKPFLATLAATAGPGVAGRALMSPWVQWALRNRAYAPENMSPLARIGQAAGRGYLATR